MYRFLRNEAGLAANESQNLLAGGMLITTMMGLRMTDDSDRDPSSRKLLSAVFAERPDLKRSRTEPEPEPEPELEPEPEPERELTRETEA